MPATDLPVGQVDIRSVIGRLYGESLYRPNFNLSSSGGFYCSRNHRLAATVLRDRNLLPIALTDEEVSLLTDFSMSWDGYRTTFCTQCNTWHFGSYTLTCRCCAECSVRCSQCSQCSEHCTCLTCSHESRSIKGSGVWKGDNGRLAGLEIEYNYCKDFKPIKAWAEKWLSSIHTDGSCGWECVTAPASGNLLSDQVDELVDAMCKADANQDSQCGVHVHVDARDLNLHAIRRLVRIYALVEPILYAIAGQDRASNTFCQPNGARLSSAASDKRRWQFRLIREIYYKSSPNELDRSLKRKSLDKKDCARYVGMNLCPWVAGRMRKSQDTTIEFRIHKECMDYERLIGWTRTLIALVDYANKCTWKDVDDLPKDRLKALCVIAPEQAAWICKRMRGWHADTNRRNRTVKYLPKNGWMFTGRAIQSQVEAF